MKKKTKLRLFGGAILLMNLMIIGHYNLQGLAVLALTFGFAIGYEFFVVSSAVDEKFESNRKHESDSKELNEQISPEESLERKMENNNNSGEENKLLEQGCSKEAIDYLKNPIHIYSYMQKYKKAEKEILEAIKKGRLRGCYVNEALWIENKKI